MSRWMLVKRRRRPSVVQRIHQCISTALGHDVVDLTVDDDEVCAAIAGQMIVLSSLIGLALIG